MSDSFTELNPGSGGAVMDETAVTYPSAPFVRRRTRIQVGGKAANQLAEVQSTEPTPEAMGLVVRVVEPRPPVGGFLFGAVDLVPGATAPCVEFQRARSFRLLGFSATGEGDGKFELSVENVVVASGRISAMQRSISVITARGMFVDATAWVRLRVSAEGLGLARYEGTVFVS